MNISKILILLCSLMIVGCDFPSGQKVSINRAERVFRRQRAILARIVDDVPNGQTTVVIYSVANKPLKHFDHIISSVEEIQRALKEIDDRRKRLTARDSGTYFVPLFERILSRAAESDAATYVCLVSDAGADDRDREKLVALSKGLADASNVKAVFIGPVPTSNIEFAEKIFAPLKQAGKLFMLDANSPEGPTLEAFESRIEANKPRLLLFGLDISGSTTTGIKTNEE